MSREEKINKMIEEIKIRRNDEQYRGGPFPIYHIEFDILLEEIERLNNIINEKNKEIEKLNNQLQQKENIIKEVREKIEEELCQGGERETRDLVDGYELLEILDKENKQ